MWAPGARSETRYADVNSRQSSSEQCTAKRLCAASANEMASNVASALTVHKYVQ